MNKLNDYVTETSLAVNRRTNIDLEMGIRESSSDSTASTASTANTANTANMARTETSDTNKSDTCSTQNSKIIEPSTRIYNIYDVKKDNIHDVNQSSNTIYYKDKHHTYNKATSDVGYDSEEFIDNNLQHIISLKRTAIQKSDKYVTCIMRAHALREQNKKMKAEMKERLYVLDTKYRSYTRVTDRVQISIIIIATASAFLQASSKLTDISAIFLGFLSLAVSTYTGLLLSIIKYTKIDDKKEQIHNLQTRFSEFITSLEHREEKLLVWIKETLWVGEGETILEKRHKQWLVVEKNLMVSLPVLCELKTSLCGEFDKLMDSNAQSALGLYAREEQLHLRQQRNKLKKLETQELRQRGHVDYEHNRIHEEYKKLESTINKNKEVDTNVAIMNGIENNTDGRIMQTPPINQNLPKSQMNNNNDSEAYKDIIVNIDDDNNQKNKEISEKQQDVKKMKKQLLRAKAEKNRDKRVYEAQINALESTIQDLQIKLTSNCDVNTDSTELFTATSE
jgi:hypothetical protein